MKTNRIQNWFNELKEKKPNWSSLMIFNTCITGKKVGKMELGRAFNKLVDKEDWQGNPKDNILKFCYSLIFKKS